MAVLQFVKFNINNQDFGIEITKVSEISKPIEIFKVPNTPKFIEGLINLRGHVLTVFNLRKRFDLDNKEFDDNTKFIIVNVDDMQVGFIVDEVNEIIRVDQQDIESTPSTVSNFDKKYLSGIAKHDNKLILLLDLARILSSDETDSIKQLVESNKDSLLQS